VDLVRYKNEDPPARNRKVFKEQGTPIPCSVFSRPILMENPHPARGGTLATKRQTFNKKQFIQYEPDLVEELNDKKTKNQSVSGRLLTLLYKRLSFWSRYAKHQHKGRRYFWKSIPELSEELQYSEKQIGRGLKALAELGMIVREKLNKHNWKHTYYYYLPHSVHTQDIPETTPTRATSTSGRSTGCSSGRSRDRQTPVRPIPPINAPTASQEHLEDGARPSRATSAPTTGTGCSSSTQTVLVQQSDHQRDQSRQKHRNSPSKMSASISIENNPLLEKQLRQIAEKCLDYAINPPKPLTKGGVGFAT